MNGVVFDVNVQGHARYILQLLEALNVADLWEALDLPVLTVAGLGYADDVPDRVIWDRCQADGLLLVTENRNDDGPDSLQRVMGESNSADSLPVLTIANKRRFERDRPYAQVVAKEFLNVVSDTARGLNRGAGRMYLPPRPVA
jgi:hypothetical protein